MTIKWNKLDACGTSLRGYFQPGLSFPEAVARLITISGQKAASSDGYKTSIEFRGTYDGEVFTLYDYKGDDQIHIGGSDGLDVEALQAALLAELAAAAPTPYTAKYFYDEREGESHNWPDKLPWNEGGNDLRYPIKPLPPDPEGMNQDRSNWAEQAILTFAKITGTDRADALADLLANLMHWADRAGYEFDAELERARGHYEAETTEVADEN